MNVISLFNGAIPLIALQLSAYKQGDNITLAFIKVLDRVFVANEDEEQYVVTDIKYWENRSTAKILKSVDMIFDSMKEFTGGYELKYNKFYIGLAKDGVSKNFLMFRLKKNFLYLIFKGNEDNELVKKCEDEGLDLSYKSKWKEFRLRLNDFDEYHRHKEFIDGMIKMSMEYFNVLE